MFNQIIFIEKNLDIEFTRKYFKMYKIFRYYLLIIIKNKHVYIKNFLYILLKSLLLKETDRVIKSFFSLFMSKRTPW